MRDLNDSRLLSLEEVDCMPVYVCACARVYIFVKVFVPLYVYERACFGFLE